MPDLSGKQFGEPRPAAFQTTAGKTLVLHEVDAKTARDTGNPGSTHVLKGSAGGGWHMFGTIKHVTGKNVRVPGWSSRKGVLATFTPSVIDEQSGTVPVKGWVGR